VRGTGRALLGQAPFLHHPENFTDPSLQEQDFWLGNLGNWNVEFIWKAAEPPNEKKKLRRESRGWRGRAGGWEEKDLDKRSFGGPHKIGSSLQRS